jgi:hypothetical protein
MPTCAGPNEELVEFTVQATNAIYRRDGREAIMHAPARALWRSYSC